MNVRWQGHEAIVLERGPVRLVVVPSLGARVVSLVDRRSDREWLVQGAVPAPGVDWSRDDAVFGGHEAFGWDECLPTMSPCPDPLDPDAPPLRDHGEQWGRATDVDHDPEVGSMTATWSSTRWPYTFQRVLRIEGSGVVADYELAPTGDRAIPFLWSMHALLALEPGSHLVVSPAGQARLTHDTGLGLPPGLGEVAWPDGAPERLDVVRPITAGQAAKLYLDARTLDRAAARAGDGSELRFSWDRDVAPTLGIWLAYGGWPAGDVPRHQVALEPTTSPDDDLAAALAAGRARWLEPGRVERWSVRLELGAPEASPAT